VICHNANCVEPTDPEDDDTIPAMRQSLALEIDGQPALDAVEIDSFWRGSDDTCLLAHDLTAPRTTPFAEAAAEIASFIENTPVLTRTPGPFRVFMELKPQTTSDDTSQHTPEQRIMHARCVWDAYATVAQAAMVSGKSVEVVFASFEPDLLRAVIDNKPAATPIPWLLDTFYGIPAPLDPSTHPLNEFHGIPLDIVEIHPQWIHDAQWEGLQSLGVEIVFWMFSATVESFAAIQQYEPDWVGTSEARLMVRWLEY
jgi:hypothetical protein